jgi:hypothetical protein
MTKNGAVKMDLPSIAEGFRLAELAAAEQGWSFSTERLIWEKDGMSGHLVGQMVSEMDHSRCRSDNRDCGLPGTDTCRVSVVNLARGTQYTTTEGHRIAFPLIEVVRFDK